MMVLGGSVLKCHSGVFYYQVVVQVTAVLLLITTVVSQITTVPVDPARPSSNTTPHPRGVLDYHAIPPILDPTQRPQNPLLLWCPVQSYNTNCHFPNKGVPNQSKITVPLREPRLRPDFIVCYTIIISYPCVDKDPRDRES